MIKAGIIGGAGYTAGELLRLLINHPNVEISFVQSSSQAGRPISEIHADLLGEMDDLFVAVPPSDPEVVFLCSGHGRSKAFLDKHPLPERVKIIDLSSDFRLAKNADGFVYGLPELNRERIEASSKIANPGCFATAIQLALLPLAANGELKNEVHVHAITGSTGAGQQPVPTTHFSWRSNNVSVYKPFQHQHLFEIGESLCQLQTGFDKTINFLPVRGSFSRGIFASTYLKTSLSETAAKELFKAFYQHHPFVKIAAQNLSLKQVVNTNNCHLFLEKHEDKLLIISVIDNLLKGASGQAVQNMNLLFGLKETAGLRLKASSF